MSGFRTIKNDGRTVLHPVVWVDPEEIPVIFVLMKNGATALAHPDYIAQTLFDVATGDLDPADAWDVLLVKTPNMPYPTPCKVRMLAGANGAAEVLFGNKIVYKFP